MSPKYLIRSSLVATALFGATLLPAQTVVEDFEFASSDPNAAAGVTVSGTPTPSVFSATGGDASEGTFALRADYVFSGAAFEAAFVERFFAAPYSFASPVAVANVAGFHVRIDVKGDPAFAGSIGTNIFMILFDNDGEQWRFINFTEPALASASYTNGLELGFFDIASGTVADSVLTQVAAVQIIVENPEAVAKSGSIYFDKIEFEETSVATTTQIIDDFEFATDDTAADTATDTFNDGSVILTPRSGSGANANEGSFALGYDFNMGGVAFEFGSMARTLGAPVMLGESYSETNPAGTQISDLRLRIDLKGDAVFASAQNTSIWIRLFEADGDTWRFINFSDPVLNSSTYTDDHLVGFFDREATAGDGNLTAITGWEILFQNPDAVAKVGTIYVDDLKIEEPAGAPTTGLTYVVSLITPGQAPNVTDTTFDAIYSNAGAHQAIAGDDWKDWESRTIDPSTPVSMNPTNPSEGAAIAATSKAYFISDGVNLYFGMLVYDSNTALMTGDTGNDTFSKFFFEDVEVAISAQPGTGGVGDEFKVAMDAFGNIDDFMPDGTIGLGVDTTAKTMHNSYIIDANTWALEWQVGLEEIFNLSTTNLTTTIPAPPVGVWYGHVGYQAPFSGPNGRVLLYAAGHGNGFGNYTITFDLTNLPSLFPAATDWEMFE